MRTYRALTTQQKENLKRAKENHFITETMGDFDTPDIIEYYRWCREKNLPQVTITHGRQNKLWGRCEVKLRDDSCFSIEASISLVELINQATIDYTKISRHISDEWQWKVSDDISFIEGKPMINIENIAISMYDIALNNTIPYREYHENLSKINQIIKDKINSYKTEECITKTLDEINKDRSLSGLPPIIKHDNKKEQRMLMNRWDKILERKRYENTFSENEIMIILETVGQDEYYYTLDMLSARTPKEKYSRQDIEDRLTGKY